MLANQTKPLFARSFSARTNASTRLHGAFLRDEAEDAVQEAYLKAFSHFDEFRGDAGIGTWLCRIVMNESLGRLRRQRPMLDWRTMDENGTPGGEINKLSVGSSRPDPERPIAQRQIQQLLEQARRASICPSA